MNSKVSMPRSLSPCSNWLTAASGPAMETGRFFASMALVGQVKARITMLTMTDASVAMAITLRQDEGVIASGVRAMKLSKQNRCFVYQHLRLYSA